MPNTTNWPSISSEINKKDLIKNTREIGNALIKLGIINNGDLDKIINYQENFTNNKWEMLSFWEIIFESKNMNDLNRKKISDFIKENWIKLNSKEKLKFENFKLKWVVIQQENTSAKVENTINTPKKKKLWEALIEAKYINQSHLDKALEYQALKKKDGKQLMIWEILMILDYVEKRNFIKFIEKNPEFNNDVWQLLIAHNFINWEQIENAKLIQKECKSQWIEKDIWDILVEDLWVISKERLLKIRAQQKNMERIKPSVSELNWEVFFLFDEDKMKKLNFVPYKIFETTKEIWKNKEELTGFVITVLSEDWVWDKADEITREIKRKFPDIKKKLIKSGKDIQEKDLTLSINFWYTSNDEIHNFIDECFKEKEVLKESIWAINLKWKKEIKTKNGNETILNIWSEYVSSTNSNLNIFAGILKEAINLWSSDLHIEPQADCLRIRIRIDWALQVLKKLPIQISESFIRSIKNNFEFADWYKSWEVWDERLNIRDHDKGCDIDWRVSIVPIKYWDKITCRLLVHSDTVKTLQELWMQPNIAKKYDLICAMSNGIIIVTWPTWSGKTTTLNATLAALNDEGKNITTIEDPVEYTIPWVNHIDAWRKNSISFKDAVKSILRQDPDIIMFWEMRDKESAENALRAGLTWRLLFSTLHTNDAISAIPRLLDMWIQPFLLWSTLVSIAWQRLVRKICPHCKIPYTPDEKHIHYFRRYLANLDEFIKDNDVKFYKWKGCDHCNDTWYKWRLSIVELFCVNEELKIAVLAWKTSSELTNIARRYGMTSMAEDGICRALSWETTIEEVLRITRTNQFPAQKRKVEEIQYLLHWDMSQQEIEDAVYGTTYEKADTNTQMVKILEKDSELLEESVEVEKKICANEEHMAHLAESNNALVANNTLVMKKLIETQSKLIDVLTNQKVK